MIRVYYDSVEGGSLIAHDRCVDYRSRWDVVQGDFIDEPRKAVTDADALVGEVLDDLSKTFHGQRRSLEQQWEDDKSTTEDMRLALRRYRTSSTDCSPSSRCREGGGRAAIKLPEFRNCLLASRPVLALSTPLQGACVDHSRNHSHDRGILSQHVDPLDDRNRPCGRRRSAGRCGQQGSRGRRPQALLLDQAAAVVACTEGDHRIDSTRSSQDRAVPSLAD
jgi:hypothetical protein